ncbi:stalk domain-containing protein [Paenibacillus polymyxa]|uniref:stalk domain-containing protein n=1 Tax=Paenibacillus TaxID=44249 RepID=UPI000E3DC746|nr:stalk domain-containing protein [Paenibacillus jamilae]RFT93683.1 glycosyl hydrolase [Paenibacillus jamilae]
MKIVNKALLSSVILLSTAAGIYSPMAQAEASKISIMLDGYPLPFPVQPAMMNGTTMVPFRAISEALGITVKWDQASQSITATKTQGSATKQVVLKMGSRNATVDGQTVQLTAAPQTVRGSTMIPLGFFGQQFGATVNWNQGTRTVSITSPREAMYTVGFYALSSFDQKSKIPNFNAVAFGWSRIDTNGQFTTTGKEYKWPQAAGAVTPESILQEADSQGTSPYLMVYSVDGNHELTKVLENAQLQEQTISQIVSTATDKQFKGITLDLEGLGWSGDKAKARSDYNAFIKKLSAKAHQAGLKLTVVLHPLNSSYAGYDYKTLGNLADDLIIMAYDYGQKSTPEPLDKVDEAIKLALKETSRDKLILGISMGSEKDSTVNAKIGLAKRYDLKGIAIWRLGIIGETAWAQMNEAIEFK